MSRKIKLIIIIIVIASILLSASTVYFLKIAPYKTDVAKLSAYSITDFFYSFKSTNESDMSSDVNTLEVLAEIFPLELVKYLGNNKICAIYKFIDQEGSEVLAHIIFEKRNNGYENYWQKTGEIYFVTNKLSSLDYENVNIGDSIDKITEFDPSVIYNSKFKYIKPDDYNSTYFYAYRPLSDGFMYLEFKNSALNSNEYIVLDKKFYPYNGNEILNLSLFNNYKKIEYLD